MTDPRSLACHESEAPLREAPHPTTALCEQARWFATRSWRQFITDPDIAVVFERHAVHLALLIEAVEPGRPPTPIHTPCESESRPLSTPGHPLHNGTPHISPPQGPLP